MANVGARIRVKWIMSSISEAELPNYVHILTSYIEFSGININQRTFVDTMNNFF